MFNTSRSLAKENLSLTKLSFSKDNSNISFSNISFVETNSGINFLISSYFTINPSIFSFHSFISLFKKAECSFLISKLLLNSLEVYSFSFIVLLFSSILFCEINTSLFSELIIFFNSKILSVKHSI